MVGAALALAADDDYGYGPPPTTTAPAQTTTTPAAASGPARSYRATLGTRAEVPRPNAPARAAGVFTAKVTESQGRATIRWTLTFRRLSGAAVAAHIHRGGAGVAGPVVVALCGPCRNGQNGRRVVDDELANRLRTGFYVNVHTAKNPAGEIRGQLRRVGS
ncbi:MAG TPA: CHRD domain-containing protein [Gaiella sp.]|nr:CHRD domain-containing protein [Gaiella sp.]